MFLRSNDVLAWRQVGHGLVWITSHGARPVDETPFSLALALTNPGKYGSL